MPKCTNSNAEYDAGNHINASYPYSVSGNDVWHENAINFRVGVSSRDIAFDYNDGTNSGSGHYNYSNPGYPNDILSPDVSIVTGVSSTSVNGKDLWALVVYYDPSTNQYFIHEYQGNISSTVFTLTDMGYTEISGGVELTKISDPCVRIDGNLNGDFAIVYSAYPTLRTITGTMQGIGYTPRLGRDLDLANASGMDQCDIAIAEYSSQGIANVFYTYSIDGGATIYVSKDEFYSLYTSATSVNSITDTRTIGTNYYFKTPRIACPNYITGLGLDSSNWAVCWESEKIGDNSYMLGLMCSNNTRYPGTSSTSYYNYSDGTEQPLLPIATVGKIYPAISYDNYDLNGGYNYIKMAWFGKPGVTSSTIGISTDEQGVVINHLVCVPGGECYEYASNSPTNKQIWPSLAGRHGFKMNIAFVDDNTPRIIQKDFDYCNGFKMPGQSTVTSATTNHPPAATLKQSNIAAFPSLHISPNPSSSEVSFFFNTDEPFKTYQLTITDMMGRQLLSTQGQTAYLNNVAANQIKKLHPGVYLISILQENRIIVSSKIIRI